MEEVVIIGGKGTAVNIAEQIDDANRRFGFPMRVLGFAIDDPELGCSIGGFPVVCGTNHLRDQFEGRNTKFIFALYRPDAMKNRVELLASYGLSTDRFATFVHPSAYVAKSARIGHGSVVLAHSSIMRNVVVGNFCIINSQVVIEHDTNVGCSAFLAAGACIGAQVHIGQGAFVGLNSALRENVNVGAYAFVGMGSVVLRDIPDYSRAYGNPAEATN
jgi:acetyltransferase EpsM